MIRNRHIPGAVLAVLVLASNSVAQPFFLRKDIPVGPNPVAVIAGDFNGDGRPDLAVGTDEGIVVFLNKGGSDFGPPVLTGAPRNLFWLSVSADFNGDGKDDLIGSGFLFLSRGDGTFLPGRYIGVQEAVAAADFNRDGKVDLLVSDYNWNEGTLATHGVRVFTGNGDGTFQFAASVTAEAAVQVRIADLNGDGKTDIALLPMPGPSGASSAYLAFLGRGDGTFGPAIRVPAQLAGPFLLADFNGDGLPDLFTTSGVMLGKGDGTFQSADPNAGKLDFPIAAADFTGDGKADLVVWLSAGSIGVRSSKGDGTFSPAQGHVIGRLSWTWSTVAIDLDGDGRLDLLGVNWGYSNTLSILMARGQDSPSLRRAVSTASGSTIVAPESLATLYGATTVTAAASASPPWPTRLGGISLEVRDSAGDRRLSPLLYVSATQINFRVPAETALGEAMLAVVSDTGSTEVGSMQVDAVAPGLFMISNGAEFNVPAATGVLVNPDGTQASVPIWGCSDEGCWLEPIALSAAGGRPIYLSFFGTGFRGVSPNNVTCSVGGIRLPVLYAGPQQIPGVDQINVQLLPKVLEALNCDPFWGCDLASLTIRIGGVPANSLWLAVQ